MSYRLELFKKAAKELAKVDRVVEQRLRDRMKELAFNPFDERLSKPIRMAEGHRSSRVGDWRIIYQVNETEKLIEIISIWPRGKAYQK